MKKIFCIIMLFLSFSLFAQPVLSELYYLDNPDYFRPKETDYNYKFYMAIYNLGLEIYTTNKDKPKSKLNNEMFKDIYRELIELNSLEANVLALKIEFLLLNKNRYFEYLLKQPLFLIDYLTLSSMMEIDPEFPNLKEVYYNKIIELNKFYEENKELILKIYNLEQQLKQE